MRFRKECVEITCNRIIPIQENKCKVILKNPNEQNIIKVRIDGCVINDHRKRCDYLVIDSKGTEYFIELKGSDTKYALEQINDTILYISEKEDNRTAIIVYNKNLFPRLNPRKQKIKKDSRTDSKTNILFIKSGSEYTIC